VDIDVLLRTVADALVEKGCAKKRWTAIPANIKADLVRVAYLWVKNVVIKPDPNSELETWIAQIYGQEWVKENGALGAILIHLLHQQEHKANAEPIRLFKQLNRRSLWSAYHAYIAEPLIGTVDLSALLKVNA
jgi:hypothetical protein